MALAFVFFFSAFVNNIITSRPSGMYFIQDDTFTIVFHDNNNHNHNHNDRLHSF